MVGGLPVNLACAVFMALTVDPKRARAGIMGFTGGDFPDLNFFNPNGPPEGCRVRSPLRPGPGLGTRRRPVMNDFKYLSGPRQIQHLLDTRTRIHQAHDALSKADQIANCDQRSKAGAVYERRPR